jgi:hypothetical protein
LDVREMKKSASGMTASANGMTYRFAVRSVPSPMAYRARAILPTGARISGFGNTKADAVRDMTARVQNYADMYYPEGVK